MRKWTISRHNLYPRRCQLWQQLVDYNDLGEWESAQTCVVIDVSGLKDRQWWPVLADLQFYKLWTWRQMGLAQRFHVEGGGHLDFQRGFWCQASLESLEWRVPQHAGPPSSKSDIHTRIYTTIQLWAICFGKWYRKQARCLATVHSLVSKQETNLPSIKKGLRTQKYTVFTGF